MLRKPAPKRKAPATTRARKAAQAVLKRPAAPQGWDTNDEHEIELRRWRGRTEIAAVQALEPAHPIFGVFRARSDSGSAYDVEIRSLNGHDNSCGCIDHQVSGLGTCKHIEGVLAALRRRGVLAFRRAAAAGSSRIELFLRRSGDPMPVLLWPREATAETEAVGAWLAPWLDPQGQISGTPAAIEAITNALGDAPSEVREHLRLSRHFTPWLQRQRRERSRRDDRAAFLDEVERGVESFDRLRHPLLPYQREGMLHLAFAERGLLADEMGLGKPSRRSPPANSLPIARVSNASWSSAPPR